MSTVLELAMSVMRHRVVAASSQLIEAGNHSGRAAAGGADGATFPFQTLTERVRLVGENCFATVSSGTAFCTDCGDAMPSEDADPDVRILQAQMPSVTMASQRQAPERWQQVAHRTYLSTTAFVDPKHANKFGVIIQDSGRSIRFSSSRCCSISSWHSFVSCRDTTTRLLGLQLLRAVVSIVRHGDVLDCEPSGGAC